MEGCEDEGHEHEGMPEMAQLLIEAIFPVTRDCMSKYRLGDMVKYIEQCTPGTRRHTRLPTVYSDYYDGNQVQETQTPGREREQLL